MCDVPGWCAGALINGAEGFHVAGKELLQRHVADRDTATPQDVLDTRVKVERLLEIIQGKEVLAEEAWLAMQKCLVDAKEISILEKGVTRVTNWILGPAEMMLNGQQEVGFDVISAEELRQEHETLELQCRVGSVQGGFGHVAKWRLPQPTEWRFSGVCLAIPAHEPHLLAVIRPGVVLTDVPPSY